MHAQTTYHALFGVTLPRSSNRKGIPLKSHEKSFFVLFGLLVLATATTLEALPFRNQETSTSIGQRKGEEDEMPVADFVLQEPIDPQERALRQARGSRYNRGQEPIAELALGTEPLPLNNHWWWGLPALPASKSEAILVGAVVGAQAYLSSDKSGIYSEFRININEVLKNESNAMLVSGGEVIAERLGGIVRFPSGRRQRYSTAQQGMPIVGRKYLFFLKCNGSGKDFSLLTGYELRDGRVLPLDGYGSKGEHAIPSFTKFEGMDEANFFKAVSDAISNPSQDLFEKGKRNR